MIEAIINIGMALYIMFVFSFSAYYHFVRYSALHWATKVLLALLSLPVFAFLLPINVGIFVAQKYIKILEE
jgi:hypothetical protein